MAPVDERSRHQLYVTLETLMGHEEVDTMMSLLPPVGWADVATEQDLLALEERLDLRLSMRFDAIDHRFESLDHRFDAIDQRFESLDHRFATKDDLDARFRTMLVTLVGLLLTQTSLLLTVLVVTR